MTRVANCVAMSRSSSRPCTSVRPGLVSPVAAKACNTSSFTRANALDTSSICPDSPSGGGAPDRSAWFQRRDALDSTATSDERQDNGPVPVTL